MTEAKLNRVHFVSLVKRMSCHNLIGSFSVMRGYAYRSTYKKISKSIRLEFLHIRLTCQTTFIFGSRQKKLKNFVSQNRRRNSWRVQVDVPKIIKL